jgi:hypothetical protein
MLHLFSASQEQVRYGAEHYRQRSNETSRLLWQLFQQYKQEGVSMPYTMEDFNREFTKRFLEHLTPQERLQGLPPEELLKAPPPEERVKGLSPEQLLKALPPEERAALLKRLQGDDTAAAK